MLLDKGTVTDNQRGFFGFQVRDDFRDEDLRKRLVRAQVPESVNLYVDRLAPVAHRGLPCLRWAKSANGVLVTDRYHGPGGDDRTVAGGLEAGFHTG